MNTCVKLKIHFLMYESNIQLLVGILLYEDVHLSSCMNQIYRLQYSAAGGYITVRGCSPFAVENFSRNLQQGIAGTYWKVILIIKGGVRQSEKGVKNIFTVPTPESP